MRGREGEKEGEGEEREGEERYVIREGEKAVLRSHYRVTDMFCFISVTCGRSTL